jgi:DNA modification methylase
MNKIEFGNCIDTMQKWKLEGVKVQMCVTSPPYYGLRSYLPTDHPDKLLEIGLEETPEQYIERMVEVFRGVRDILADDGVVFINIGDSYYNYRPGKGQAMVQQTVAINKRDTPDDCPRRGNKLEGLKEKDLIGIPFRLAFALQQDGWYWRQNIIWKKLNPLPESVKDRFTNSHEYILLLSKKSHYFFDNYATRELASVKDKSGGSVGGKKYTQNSEYNQHNYHQSGKKYISDGYRNKRSVWSVATKPLKESHFAAYPPELIEPCVLSGTSERGHCPQCGARWKRIVESQSKEVERHEDGHCAHRPPSHHSGQTPHRKENFEQIVKNVYWEAGCSCAVDPVPDIVFDPFMGSGTTAMVALQHGRQYLGCELNTDYKNIQIKRVDPVEKEQKTFNSLFDEE